MFRPFYNAFSGPLESLGWGFRVVTNSAVDILCFGFNLIRTIVVFLFDVTYFLVWIVRFCSSFIVFKLPVKLKSSFFTILELLDLALGVAVEVCSQTSDWTFWLVNSWLPKIWEEHFWKVIKLSISFLTLFYTLIREDWRSSPLEVLSVMSRLVMQLYTSFCDPSQIHLLNHIIWTFIEHGCKHTFQQIMFIL